MPFFIFAKLTVSLDISVACFCQRVTFAGQKLAFQLRLYTSAAGFRRKSEPLYSTPPLLLWAVLFEIGCTAIQFHANVNLEKKKERKATLNNLLITLYHLGEPSNRAPELLHWECDSQILKFPLSAVQPQREEPLTPFKQPKLKLCTKNRSAKGTYNDGQWEGCINSEFWVTSGTQTYAL